MNVNSKFNNCVMSLLLLLLLLLIKFAKFSHKLEQILVKKEVHKIPSTRRWNGQEFTKLIDIEKYDIFCTVRSNKVSYGNSI